LDLKLHIDFCFSAPGGLVIAAGWSPHPRPELVIHAGAASVPPARMMRFPRRDLRSLEPLGYLALFDLSDHPDALDAVRGPTALTQLLTQTDILVLPSLYEGLPLSVLEAQRCGVVVIVTEAGAVREAVTDGETGFVVPQADCIEQIAARILELDADRDMLARISRAAAQTSRSWADATEGLLNWLGRRLKRPAQFRPDPERSARKLSRTE